MIASPSSLLVNKLTDRSFKGYRNKPPESRDCLRTCQRFSNLLSRYANAGCEVSLCFVAGRSSAQMFLAPVWYFADNAVSPVGTYQGAGASSQVHTRGEDRVAPDNVTDGNIVLGFQWKSETRPINTTAGCSSTEGSQRITRGESRTIAPDNHLSPANDAGEGTGHPQDGDETATIGHPATLRGDIGHASETPMGGELSSIKAWSAMLESQQSPSVITRDDMQTPISNEPSSVETSISSVTLESQQSPSVTVRDGMDTPISNEPSSIDTPSVTLESQQSPRGSGSDDMDISTESDSCGAQASPTELPSQSPLGRVVGDDSGASSRSNSPQPFLATPEAPHPPGPDVDSGLLTNIPYSPLPYDNPYWQEQHAPPTAHSSGDAGSDAAASGATDQPSDNGLASLLFDFDAASYT